MGEIESEYIKGLVIIFFRVLITPTPKQYTTLYSVAWSLAKKLKQKKALEQLKSINECVTDGWPLGLLEVEVFRLLSFGFPTSKVYNYGLNRGKTLNGQQMIMFLDEAKAQILDVFNQICIDEELDVPIATALIGSPAPESQSM